MHIESLFAQEFPIPPHAIMAIIALVVGGAQMALPKGTKRHRLLGYGWVIMMAGTAISALFIHRLKMWGAFSPIHLLIPFVLFSLWRAVAAARRGDIPSHRNIMKNLYFFALILTGAFTLLPGRVMNGVLFGAG